ncbi:histone acetylation protein-domain-containing protein [Hypoxylon fuscum]|nr:histone acetylation protein-domain-containing protein [Hypoxylon fuscum]
MSNTKQAGAGDRVVNPHPLIAELAKVLPKDRKFAAHHLSTTPTATDPLCYSPAANSIPPSKENRPSKPLKTYCEKHFLTVSIDTGKDEERQVIVLGLEIYIYTTSFSTIIFVSKADSTGYLNLLNLPKGTPSPIREVTACFLAFLISNRRRPTKQLVVNLFARSQSQYLFPGSVKNNGKHVLDDRGLVKWWSRVLNAMLEGRDYSEMRNHWDSIHGYLIIPGLDNYETRAFLPRTDGASTNWTLGHPLEIMSPYTKDPGTFGHNIHPRSLIPTFPDDPKARFIQELEESVPEKAKLLSGWKTPRTLDQFWDMMAFRQECSSGRLTGFIWVVFEPEITSKPKSLAVRSAAGIITPNTSFSASTSNAPAVGTPRRIQKNAISLITPGATPSKGTRLAKKSRRKPKAKKVLTGPIIPRKPQVKTHRRVQFPEMVETPHYYWPENGRGQVVLNENGYKRAVELLLHLEFGTLEQAIASTARWTMEVNMGDNWALEIVGQRAAIAATTTTVADGAVNNLSGMIRRKRAADDHSADGTTSTAVPVTTLGGGLVRKKAKIDTDTAADASTNGLDQSPTTTESEPKVNVLGTGLVRKKSKTS